MSRFVRGELRYLAGYLADRAADGLFYLALSWLATRADSPVGAAVVIAAGSIPRVLILLAGGVVADRFGLARVVRWTLVARAALMAPFALAASSSTPPVVILAFVAAAVGAVDALHMPAINGLSGLVVRGDATVRLQGLMNSLGNALEIAVAPAAAFLLAWRAPSLAVACAALLLLGLACIPSGVALPAPVTDEPPRSMVQAVRDVLTYAARERLTRAMLGVFAAANFAATPSIVLGIPLILRERGEQELEFGTLMTAFAVGSVAGGLALSRWGPDLQWPARWSLLLMLPGAAGIIAVAVTPTGAVAAAAMATTGLCFSAGAGLLMGRIKAMTPPQLMGRMMSLVQLAVYSCIPLGMLAFGSLSSIVGASAVAVGMAVVMGSAALIGLTVGPLWSGSIPSTRPGSSRVRSDP